MEETPIEELREIRREIERECAAKGRRYADYLSEVQDKYTDRLVRREPRPRLVPKASAGVKAGTQRK